MFEPIGASPSAAQRCADAIREQILSGALGAGARLPAERELAASLGVNRLTLRAALLELRAAGLVRVKHGSGYTVEPFAQTSGPALLPALVKLSANNSEARRQLCADLLLLRRHLAAAALTKLASRPIRATDEIAAAIARFAELADSGASPDELAIADVEIVAAILDATDSLAFRLILNPLTRALDEVPELRGVMYRDPADNARGYAGLLAWLRSPNVRTIGLVIELLETRDRETLSLLDPVRRRKGRK